MKEAPKSYKDPYWTNLATSVEQKLSLPSGLLVAIKDFGERSNNDQVSEAGAKTVFQIIPQTRKAVLEKYGVDAYLSPENAAEAAGLIIKESLQRNKGDVTQAIGEYIGGTNRSNWGKVTNSYINRVATGFEQAQGQQQEVKTSNLGEAFKQWKQTKQATPTNQAEAGQETQANQPDINSAFAQWKQSKQQPAQQEPSLTDRLARQAGLAARMGAEGLAGFAGIVTDPVAALVNQVLPEDQRLSTLQGATSQALTNLGVPVPEGEMERGVQSAGQALVGGGASVGTGLAMRGGRELLEQVGKFLSAAPAQQLTGSAGAGAAQQIAAESGAGPVGQTAAAIGGALLGDRAAATRTRAPITAPLAAAEAENIPVMTSDIVRPETFVGRSAQNIGERIPVFGTGGTRATQEEARKQAVKRLAQDYGADQPTRFDEAITQDLIKKRGAELQKYTQLKGDVFERLNQSGAVPLNRTLNQLDAEIAKLEGIESIPRSTIQDLQALRNDFESAKSIGDVEFLRKLLGDKLSDPSLATVKTAVDKIPGRVYKELKQDMGDFIKANGERRDYEKWRIADNRLAQLSGELKDTKLRRVLSSGESTPEAVNRLLFSTQRSDVERLFKGLTPKGREYAQSALIKQAFDKSVTDAAEGTVSTVRFANELRKLSDQTGVFFNKQDQQRIEGLQTVLDLTRRASDAGVQTATGQQLAVPAIGTALGALFGSFFSAVLAGGTVGGIARAYESKAMRDFLMRLGSAKGKEKAKLQDIVKRQVVPVILATQQNQF